MCTFIHVYFMFAKPIYTQKGQPFYSNAALTLNSFLGH